MHGPLIFLFCFALGACSPRGNKLAEPVLTGTTRTALAQKPVPVRPVIIAQDTSEEAVVGHCDMPLTKAQPESSLGNYLADAMLAAGRRIDPQVVAAVSNYGALRMDYLPPGPITLGEIRQLMPFDNVLVVLEIPGRQLQQLCDLIAQRKGWPVSGISFIIGSGKAVEVQVAGSSLIESILYKVVVNNYLAKGKDGCDFLQGLQQYRSRVLVRTALIDYLSAFEREKRPLHPVLEKRVTYGD